MLIFNKVLGIGARLDADIQRAWEAALVFSDGLERPWIAALALKEHRRWP